MNFFLENISIRVYVLTLGSLEYICMFDDFWTHVSVWYWIQRVYSWSFQTDIVPFDATRVKLEKPMSICRDSEIGSDYINASFISDFSCQQNRPA